MPQECALPVEVVVRDRVQDGYRYLRTCCPAGEDFTAGFEPELTPAQMLALGVFCGKYMTDCRAEFPESWFAHAKLAQGRADCAINHFGVRASVPLSVWRAKGWIPVWRAKGWIHSYDPRGWFQWYCRYYSGRRMAAEDRRQIARWRAFRRHAAQVRKNREPGDTPSAAGGSARRCCNGPMTAAACERCP